MAGAITLVVSGRGAWHLQDGTGEQRLDPFWEQIDVKVVIAPDTQEKLDELCDKMYTLLSE